MEAKTGSGVPYGNLGAILTLGFSEQTAGRAMVAEQVQARHGPEVSLAVTGPARRLSRDLELAVFRIVQEALSNVCQHARAEHARVELQFGDNGLSVTVQDDGTGFEPPELPTVLARQGHLGLAGMRERVLLVGGRLSLDSAPGRGTRVVATVPYDY